MQPIIATIKAMALTKTIHELEARRHRASRREAGEIAPGKWQMDGQLAVRIEERAKEWAKLAKHDDAANAMFDAANGRAKAYVTQIGDCERLADRAERLMDERGMKKGPRQGVILTHVGGTPPSTHPSTYACTTVVMRRTLQDWRLVSVERFDRYPGKNEIFNLKVGEEGMAQILAAATEHFSLAE
jgi:hypothetical protein